MQKLADVFEDAALAAVDDERATERLIKAIRNAGGD